MVSLSQSESEFLDESDLDFTVPDYLDTDEQMACMVCFMLIRSYYEEYQFITPEELEVRLTNDMADLKMELSSSIINKLEEIVQEDFNQQLDTYGIPSTIDDNSIGTLSPVFADEDVINKGLDSIINQLEDDLMYKIAYYQGFLMKIPFNMSPNFQRALKRVTELINTSSINAKELSHREILRFVYKDDLYNWVCVYDMRTCRTCLSLAEEPPKPLDEWGLDHPNGRCTLEPVSKEYSDNYKSIIGVL